MGNRIQYSLRNIKRNKLNAIITLASLSIALACVLIIYLFVQQEKSYNSFHENADNIYRLNYNILIKNGTKYADHLIHPDLAKVLKSEVPQMEHCTPFRIGYMAQFDLEHENMKVELGIAEQDFFNMFSFKLLYGNKDKLLVDPSNIVLTESLAKKLLKNKSNNIEELIGQSLKFTFIKDTEFTIVGILEDIPKNSTMTFEAIIPYKYQNEFWQSNNGFGNSTLFLELKNTADSKQSGILIGNVVKEFYQKNIERAQKSNFLHPSSKCFQAFLLPIKSLYLDNTVDVSYESHGNKAQLNILTIVGILILFIAFSNFIILTVGQFFKKAGEVGIRKSIGGNNIDILKMFLNENSILIFTSLIIGGVLCYLIIPVFNSISESHIYFNLLNIPSFLGFCIFTIIILITITSLIPVLIFKNVKPISIAKNTKIIGRKTSTSQLFVCLQYSLAIVLIIATILISVSKKTSFF